MDGPDAYDSDGGVLYAHFAGEAHDYETEMGVIDQDIVTAFVCAGWSTNNRDDCQEIADAVQQGRMAYMARRKFKKGGGHANGRTHNYKPRCQEISFGKRARMTHDAKKDSTCHACGEKGHWAGDPQCKSKGQKAARKGKPGSIAFVTEETQNQGSRQAEGPPARQAGPAGYVAVAGRGQVRISQQSDESDDGTVRRRWWQPGSSSFAYFGAMAFNSSNNAGSSPAEQDGLRFMQQAALAFMEVSPGTPAVEEGPEPPVAPEIVGTPEIEEADNVEDEEVESDVGEPWHERWVEAQESDDGPVNLGHNRFAAFAPEARMAVDRGAADDGPGTHCTSAASSSQGAPTMGQLMSAYWDNATAALDAQPKATAKPKPKPPTALVARGPVDINDGWEAGIQDELPPLPPTYAPRPRPVGVPNVPPFRTVTPKCGRQCECMLKSGPGHAGFANGKRWAVRCW